MFTLDNQHSFEPDAGMCWLSALSGYRDNFSWELHLQSLSAMKRFPSVSVHAAFGIHATPPLGVSDWRNLTGQSIEMSQEVLRCGFMFRYDMSQQWEDLISLRLRFGQIQGSKIEVFADGQGSIEAAPDVFPEAEVAFQIRTWVTFRGVAVNVPLNATDPLAYSTARIKALLPQYEFVPPIVRQTKDKDDSVRAVEVLFSPDESASCA